MQLHTGHSFCSGRTLLLWLVVLAGCYLSVEARHPQQLRGDQGDISAEQFFQSPVASKYSSRLVYRAGGFLEFWADPNVSCIDLEAGVDVNEADWRAEFSDTGGVAKLGPTRNLTITSACLPPVAGLDSSTWQTLNFQQLPSAMLVDTGGLLTFKDILISEIAPASAYQYTPAQPWRNAGVGFPLWPSVALAPNASLVLRNVGIAYNDPSVLDTCEQYNQKVLYGLQQQYGAGNISVVNATAGRLVGPITIPVLVLDGSRNNSGGGVAGNSSFADAHALFENVTFNCITPSSGTGGLSTTALAVAIVVPVAGLLLLGGITWCLLRSRRRKRQAAARRTAAEGSAKDLEMGTAWGPGDVHNSRDQEIDRLGSGGQVAALSGIQVPSGQHRSRTYMQRGSASTSASSVPGIPDRSSGEQTEGGSASPHGGATPMLGARAANTALHSSEESNDQYLSTVQAAAAAETMRQLPEELSARSSLQLYSTSRSASGSTAAGTARLGETSSYETVQERDSRQGSLAIDAAIHAQAAAAAAAVGYGEQGAGHRGRASAVDDSASGRYSLDVSPIGTGGTVGTPHSTGGTVNTAVTGGAPGMQLVHRGSTDSLGRGGSGRGSARSSAGQEPGAPGSAAVTSIGTANTVGTTVTFDEGIPGSSSMAGSGAMTSRGIGSSRGVPALLKARSDMAVLRDLKIGPLLGRGSYGRVYKGRWKSVTVAVKIIEHNEGAPGTASSAGKCVDVGRESLLATSIAHPNVVQTYHISTMTISQRNALASAWLSDGASSSSNLAPGQLTGGARGDLADDSDASSSSTRSSSGEVQKDVLETWMLMEFCEKGSLERAISQGRFLRRDGQPDMIGIYKALLDTASGLDYLHSIGVVHGDLKTANVLLKGSTRDVRGFACKITDFGLSRVLDLDATHVSTRTYGTITYMPSELLLTGRMTQATDIYSFGLMMWELYTSTRVFEEGLSIGQIFYMIAYQGWRPGIPAGCPQGFAALMQACWHQDPEQRPAVQKLLRSLQKLYLAEKQAVLAANKKAAAALAAASPSSAGRTTVSPASAASPPGAAPAPTAEMHPAKAARLAQAGQGQTDRVSFESQTSENYQHAIGGNRDNEQWSYPGQQQPGQPAAPPVLLTEDDPVGPPDTSPRAVSSPFAAAANAVAETGANPASTSPNRQSFQSSAGVGSAGSYREAPLRPSTDSGSGRPSGSGSTDAREEYQPWARAVSMHPQGLGGADVQPSARRQSSLRLQDIQWAAAAAEQAGAPQPGQQGTSMANPQLTGYLQHQPPLQQLTPQQQQHGYRFHPSLGFTESEIQPAVDNEAMPSESLYHNVSSASNIVPTVSGSVLFGANDDDAEQDTEVSGFLHMLPRSPGHTIASSAQQQTQQGAGPSQRGAAAAAAQGFVDALTCASGSNAVAPAPPAAAAFPGAQPSSVSQLPYHYQQRPLMLQHVSMPSTQARSSDGTYSTGWGSISTGTMPSVVADERGLTPWPTTSSLGYIGGSSTPGASSGAASIPAPHAGGTGGTEGSGSSRAGPVVTHAVPVAPQQGGTVPAGFQRYRPQAQVAAFPAGAQLQPTSAPLSAITGGPGPGAIVVPLSAVRVNPPPVVSPFAQQQPQPQPVAVRPAATTASGNGNLRRSRTPERSMTPPVFMYRTPSGRVYIPNPTTGVPQTVRESSGTTSATSGSGQDSLRVASRTSTTVSLHPAGTMHSGSPPEQTPPVQLPQVQANPPQQQSMQEQDEEQRRAAGPPPSPFAALAQRAGSLFGPM